MAGYPQTGTIINGKSGNFNRVGTGLSTNIVVMVGNNAVGAIQEISYNENRTHADIVELGTDGIIDITPSQAVKYDGSCNRIRFDRMRIAQAFSRGFVHVKSQRVGFNIMIIDKWGSDGTDDSGSVITMLTDVWITKLGASQSATNFVITDNMGFKFRDIHSYLGAPGINATTGGGTRGMPLAFNKWENDTDIGNRMGAIDAPGLINDYIPF